jgi:hypothetical protein
MPCARSPARHAPRDTTATPRASQRFAPPAPTAPLASRPPRLATREPTPRASAPPKPARAPRAPRAPTARRAVLPPCFAPRARGATRSTQGTRARACPAPLPRAGTARGAPWRRAGCFARWAASAPAARRPLSSARVPASVARSVAPPRQRPRLPPCGAPPPSRALGPAAQQSTAWAQTRGLTPRLASPLRQRGRTLWQTHTIPFCAMSRLAGSCQGGAGCPPPLLPPRTARAQLRCFTTPPLLRLTPSATPS